MKGRVSGNKRRGIFAYIARAIIVIGVVVGTTYTAPTAHADPHAIFYTAIGQQQLFFNTLAALNQADYVEPKESRDELITKRGAPTETLPGGFGPEQNETVNATHTDLAGVLTRNITLEGNDLWTTYLILQFALEKAARNNTAEVLKTFCDRGLGIPDCEKDGVSLDKIEEGQKTAFVVDPNERGSAIIQDGVNGALFSNSDPTSYDQQKRELIINTDDKDGQKQRQYVYDSPIADFRKEQELSAVKSQAVDNLTASIFRSWATDRVNPESFSDLEVNDSSGEVSLFKESSGPVSDDPTFTQRYMSALVNLINLPQEVYATAMRGANQIAAAQATAEQQGAVADTDIKPNVVEEGSNKVIKSIDSRIRVPAHAKVAAVQSGFQTIGNAEENVKFAPTDATESDGTEHLVPRNSGEVAGAKSTNFSGQVLGEATNSQTEPSTAQGVVAGTTSASTATSPNSNPVPFFKEEGYGPDLFLKAVGFHANEDGLGLSSASTIKSFGEIIMKKIQ